jgi:hypothetical protein
MNILLKIEVRIQPKGEIKELKQQGLGEKMHIICDPLSCIQYILK